MSRVRNENVFPQTILDIGLQINLHKFTKLSKAGFSVERFRADFWRFSSTNVKICLWGGRLGTRHQIQAFP